LYAARCTLLHIPAGKPWGLNLNPMLQVFVRGLDRVLTLQVAVDDTLLQLKERMQERTGVRPDAITLTLGGKPLPEEGTVGGVGLRRGATLVAVPRLRTTGTADEAKPSAVDLVCERYPSVADGGVGAGWVVA
jgi:hypothetical protein